MEEVNKSKLLIILIIIVSVILGSIIPMMHLNEREPLESPLNDYRESQTSEYPPFEPPLSNASTLDSGSIFVNGQEIFWRYFFPNTSVIQPKNFRFSFEIWWENPDPEITIVVDLSENEGESNSTSNYGTLVPYEKILETPDGDFIHYAVWMNSTYFFMNETWASFGNEFIDEENLNLTVGIQHFTYFPIFEYTITRDTIGPVIQIIHPNYDAIENKLVLDWSNTSFLIEITSLGNIESVQLIITFLNQTTFEYEEVTIWPIELEQEEGTGIYYAPSLITEKVYPDTGGGLMDIDTEHPMPASLVVVDGYGYVTSKSMDIFLEIPYSDTPTTSPSTTTDWETLIPIVSTVSIVSVAVLGFGIWRIRK